MNKEQLKTDKASAQGGLAKSQKQASSGFTLIEILISLSILFLILGGITLFSVRTLQSYTRSKAMQNAVENARFAIESLSKKLRTSHELTFGGSSVPNGHSQINFIDNVNNTNYFYNFTSGELQLGTTPIVGGNNTNITVTGGFDGETTDTDADRRGYVTITINIIYNSSGNPAEKDQVTIRSTVSLRDYNPNN